LQDIDYLYRSFVTTCLKPHMLQRYTRVNADALLSPRVNLSYHA
jgi:hypothetical protein